MKVLFFCLNLFISSGALALSPETLSFDEPVTVKKIVLEDSLLLNGILNLHNDFTFDQERMIAGDFERKKSVKKSALDN